MRLCRAGAWETLLLDDALPCTADGVLAFARGARRQLWVPLIEKVGLGLEFRVRVRF